MGRINVLIRAIKLARGDKRGSQSARKMVIIEGEFGNITGYWSKTIEPCPGMNLSRSRCDIKILTKSTVHRQAGKTPAMTRALPHQPHYHENKVKISM